MYPFGYGLSYTDIIYKNAKINNKQGTIGDDFTIEVEVENCGSYQVHEAVQLYLKDVEASTRVPNWKLCGIQNISLNQGESKNVTMKLSSRDFALITEDGKCVVEPGMFQVAVGGQQPDERSEQLTGKSVVRFEIELKGRGDITEE